MSLYDIALGDGNQGARGALLLAILGNPEPGRFRDAWVEKGDDGEPVISIYTRNGGGNRSDYAEVISALQAHPLYLRDADDELDSTYATFRFSAPPEARDVLLATAREPVNMDEKWKEAIDRFESGEMRPAEQAMADQLGAMLSDLSPDAPRIMEV